MQEELIDKIIKNDASGIEAIAKKLLTKILNGYIEPQLPQIGDRIKYENDNFITTNESDFIEELPKSLKIKNERYGYAFEIKGDGLFGSRCHDCTKKCMGS